MKKIYGVLIAILLTFSLVGCNNPNKENSTNATNENNSKITISIVIREKENELSYQEFKVKKDEFLLNVLKDNYNVVEEDNFITSIDDKNQNPNENIYWTYTVNGDFASVGANEYKLQDKDKIIFTLDKME